MNQSNEIALQLVNNYTEDINIALFPNVNNAQFVQSQTEEMVQGFFFDISGTSGLMLDFPTFKYKFKNQTTGLDLIVPYPGKKNTNIFESEDFILFIKTWFPQNGYGIIIQNSLETFTIISDNYDYIGLTVLI